MSQFAANFNVANDPITFECDDSFDTWIEFSKYCAQLLYMLPTIILYSLLIHTIMFNKEYKQNSFFKIYVFDCIAGLFMFVPDVTFARLFMYNTQLCPIVSPYFYEPAIILKFVYVIETYGRTAKSVIQIFLVINRMTCVLFPTHYAFFWRDKLKFVILLIVILPYGTCWNVMISRVYIESYNGGFALDYIKKVQWASLSKFQFGYVMSAFVFTIICSSITFYALLMLPHRMKASERSLCIASSVISLGFISAGFFQAFFAFCPDCLDTELMYQFHFYTYDYLNASSPIVMIMISGQLRSRLWRNETKDSTMNFVRVSAT